MKNYIIITAILVVLLFISFSHAVSYNINEFIVYDDGSNIDTMNLFAAGDYVVFKDIMSMELFGFQLSGRELFKIPGQEVNMYGLWLNSEYAVWTGMTTVNKLYGYDLDKREKFEIGSDQIDTMTLTLSGRYVIWRNMAGTKWVGYDLVERKDFTISGISTDTYSVKAGDSYVVWYDSMEMVLYGYDIELEELFTVSYEEIDSMNLRMNSRYLVFKTMAGETFGFDLASRQSFLISTSTVDSMSLKIAGVFAVWSDTVEMNLKAYDLAQRVEYVLSESFIDTMNLVTSERYVIWKDSLYSEWYVFDMVTKERFEIDINADATANPPAVSGDYIIYEYYDSTDPTPVTVITGYDIQSGQSFEISTLDSGASMGRIRATGGYALWFDMFDSISVFKGGQIFKVINDTCLDAIEVTEGTVYTGDSRGATGEDITSCGFGDFRDVWYRYTPASGGQVTADTDGSSFDTTLAVFNACGGQEISCNDDYGIDNTQSKVTLTTVKGKSYLIRVAGFDGQSGNYSLLISRGTCTEDIISDLNGDCKVDMADLAIFSSQWLTCNMEPADGCWN